MKKIKIICFDIDNTICKTNGNNYKKAKPIKKNIKIINKLYFSGFLIKIFTSRFMGRTNENVYLAKKKAHKFTKLQLKKWKVNYHYLIFGKPSYDLFVDDKAYGYDHNWHKKINKII